MNTFGKYLEIAYAIIGIIFIGEGVLAWADDREKAYLSIGFGILAIFMFFFKRNFRKKRSK
ncbi:hypothetical protein [Flavicella marina]|uniref:hypothetical protein n=1 Tax=Flavicella marina TaxID=1475951 RepID=UPI0012656E7B|nr:hypothetical protein [Flavicella marina]